VEDLQSLPLDELQTLCDQDAIEFLRYLHVNAPSPYRGAIIEFLNRPQVPILDILTAIRNPTSPSDAWRNVLGACRQSASRAPWSWLPTPAIERDVEAALGWVADHCRAAIAI
jgi:hypothetical protein